MRTRSLGRPRLSEAAKPQRVGDRRNLEGELQAVFDASARDGGVVSVAVLDLIGMREFNVRKGWQSGDEVVRRFWDLLGRSLEAGQRCWHLGGHAFLVAAPGHGIPALEAAISEFRTRLKGLPENERPGLTDFVDGLAQFPEDGPSVRMVVRASDLRKDLKRQA